MAALPILFSTQEDSEFKSQLQTRIQNCCSPEQADILLTYPTVYIHYWLDHIDTYQDNQGASHSKNKYNIYVGESINVVKRTNQHYEKGKDKDEDKWQHLLLGATNEPQMIIIGHMHFNKSMTLDIENQLIEYVFAMDNIEHRCNGRGNAQGNYYPSEEVNEIFHKIWSQLRKHNKDLFPLEAYIRDSAIFKASPFKKLTSEQIDAKNRILSTIQNAVKKEDGQLIFVQGEAGTGKTILTTSIFYELVQLTEQEELYGLNCHLMVNHDQQINVYKQITKRLGLDEQIVSKPTSFINNHKLSSPKVDVSFIDEGHLLLTQGKQSYQGNNQLRDIIERSKVTVVMFDKYQILTTEEYWENKDLEELENLSKKQGNFIQMDKQLRMLCALSTKKWLDDFILERKVTLFESDGGYEVKSFDTPDALYAAIKAKALTDDYRLSRLVATYDWEYSSSRRPEHEKMWGVRIGKWFKPWNYELERDMTIKEKRRIKNKAWAEQEQTIDEVGSTFTIQGFDLSYVGVILGPSVKYRDGKVVFDPSEKKNEKVTQNRTLKDGSKKTFAETLIRNEVKVLMSRGVKGLYIYACDDELRKALKNIAYI